MKKLSKANLAAGEKPHASPDKLCRPDCRRNGHLAARMSKLLISFNNVVSSRTSPSVKIMRGPREQKLRARRNFNAIFASLSERRHCKNSHLKHSAPLSKLLPC
jgi:hypothetical protein